MKRIVHSITSVAVVAIGLIVLKSSSNGAPGSYTNSPVSQGNCSACHGGGSFNADQGLELTGLPANGYDAGETYQLTLKLTSPSNSNGFQISCLDANDNNAGDFTSGTGSRGSGAQGNELSLTHASPSGTGEWIFEWTAPAANAGDLTFYAVGNATQGMGTNTADMIYGKTFTLEPSQATFVEQHELTDFSLYPNPVENNFFVEHQYSGSIPFTVFNAAGKTVRQGILKSDKTTVQAEDLQSGVYFFRSSGRVLKFIKL